MTYEVTGKILFTENVGNLIDKINKKSGTNIDSLEWEAFEVRVDGGRKESMMLRL